MLAVLNVKKCPLKHQDIQFLSSPMEQNKLQNNLFNVKHFLLSC